MTLEKRESLPDLVRKKDEYALQKTQTDDKDARLMRWILFVVHVLMIGGIGAYSLIGLVRDWPYALQLLAGSGLLGIGNNMRQGVLIPTASSNDAVGTLSSGDD